MSPVIHVGEVACEWLHDDARDWAHQPDERCRFPCDSERYSEGSEEDELKCKSERGAKRDSWREKDSHKSTKVGISTFLSRLDVVVRPLNGRQRRNRH